MPVLDMLKIYSSCSSSEEGWRSRDVIRAATLQPACASLSWVRWQRVRACLSVCRYIPLIVSISSVNITLTEQGASTLRPSLPPLLVLTWQKQQLLIIHSAVMVRLSLPLFPPPALSLSINQFQTQSADPLDLLHHSCSSLFLPCSIFLPLSSCAATTLFCSLALSIPLLSNHCQSPSSQCLLPPTVRSLPVWVTDNPLILINRLHYSACLH